MPTVQITVGGVDVTADVVFATAEFISFVNGKPGEAYMRVRDLTSTRSFETGADWLVTIDGEAAWRGFVTSVLRVFIAPALNVAEQGLQRFIDLRGADLNLLFTRRVVFKQSDPAFVEGIQFPPDTPDTTAITELLDNWLDLSADDLDTTSGVNNVGDLDPEQKTRAWSGGWYWNNAMDAIAMLPAAIYYIRPEAGSPKGTLCYVDVDEPDAPFGLSDVPDGVTTKGYRDMEIVLDGASLANDVYGWGMGYGSQEPVFNRTQSAPSQATHGLWQSSVIATGVYKQGTIDRMVDSIINGSPSSKRGAKADRPYIKLTTYEPGLLAGYVVDFSSEVWGFTDAIPVRQLLLRFEAPDVPRYEVTLSHEIDAPWSFIDSFWPEMRLPPPERNGPKKTKKVIVNCAATDNTDRDIIDGWGTTTNGILWETGADQYLGTYFPSQTFSVSGGSPNGSATVIGEFVNSDLYPVPPDGSNPGGIASGTYTYARLPVSDMLATLWEIMYITEQGEDSGSYLQWDTLPPHDNSVVPFGPELVNLGAVLVECVAGGLNWSFRANGTLLVFEGGSTGALTGSWSQLVGVGAAYDGWVAFPGVSYSVRVKYDRSTTRPIWFKVWPTAGIEPSAWSNVQDSTAGLSFTPTTSPVRMNFAYIDVHDASFTSSGGNPSFANPQLIDYYYTRTVHQVNIVGGGGGIFTDPDCEETLTEEVDTIPGNIIGWGCEDPTVTGWSTATTSVEFVPGSTLLWRDGLFQRRDTDYTEGSDHRTLRIDDGTQATLKVCYLTVTDLV